MPMINDSMRKIVRFPISPICPRCRRAVSEGTRMTDARGRIVHEKHYLIELKERASMSTLLDDSCQKLPSRSLTFAGR